jgi:wyosine [tRNA(Phe)-imidazoG37] synthetase (radical SAM superfamily)
MRVFGPVPSRRLGRSLGINNIPHKTCSYACVYCQIGRTRKRQIECGRFYEPETIFEEVRDKVSGLRKTDQVIDYLSFVPDGEPTLDESLGRTVAALRPLGVKIAVISNGSLLWRPDVREALVNTDWVSLKIDSTIEDIWRRTNRPHASLQLGSILEGMRTFTGTYRGTLVTETMLVRGLNDGEGNLASIADFLHDLQPQKAYISVPIRPPAERWVLPPSESTVAKAYQMFHRAVPSVEYLIGYEGNAFSFTGNPEQDLLSITAVHPMRKEAVEELLRKTGAEWSTVQRLLESGLLVNTEYQGRSFYMRSFSGGKAP